MKLQQGIKYPKADFFFFFLSIIIVFMLVTHNGHNLLSELSHLPEMAATSGTVSTLSLVEQGIVLCCDRVFSHCWIQVFICLPYLASSFFCKNAEIFKCWTSLGILKLPPRIIPRDCPFEVGNKRGEKLRSVVASGWPREGCCCPWGGSAGQPSRGVSGGIGAVSEPSLS